MDTQKSRYSSPVDHRSLDDLCTSTYTMLQKLCARYTLGARYLHFKRNVEKFGVRVIGRKIRYYLANAWKTCSKPHKTSGSITTVPAMRHNAHITAGVKPFALRYLTVLKECIKIKNNLLLLQ